MFAGNQTEKMSRMLVLWNTLVNDDDLDGECESNNAQKDCVLFGVARSRKRASSTPEMKVIFFPFDNISSRVESEARLSFSLSTRCCYY